MSNVADETLVPDVRNIRLNIFITKKYVTSLIQSKHETQILKKKLKEKRPYAKLRKINS